MSQRRSKRALIIGTSPESEILRDEALVKDLLQRFSILCINTAYQFFPALDFLFLNGRFTSLGDTHFSPRVIGSIFSPLPMSRVRDYKIFPFQIRGGDFAAKISTDILQPLPHGPTTLLDIVFPACVYIGFKELYILGAEYRRDVEYKRFEGDSAVVNRSKPSMDRELEMALAHIRLQEWKEFFDDSGVSCFGLSPLSQAPFPKVDLSSLL